MTLSNHSSYRAAVMVSAVAMLATGASADLIYTSDLATFMGMADGDMTLETFEDDAIDSLVDGEHLAGSDLAVFATEGWTLDVTDGEAFSFNTTEGGEKHLRVGFGSGDYNVRFGMENLVAFGFNLTGFQDFPELGGFDVTLYAGESVVDSIFIEDPGDFTAHFHGIESDVPFDLIEISFLGADIVGFDDLVFATAAVPAPGAIVLLGGAAVCGRRRRRRG